MAKVYTVVRNLRLHLDGQVNLPVKMFDDQALAIKARDERQHSFAMLVQGAMLVMPGPNGQAENTGITLAAFLAELGVTGVAHQVTYHEVSGSDLVMPQAPKIILPH